MVEQPKPALVEQCDRDAAADYMSAQDYDWGYCGDVREGRVEHPLPGLFAAHRIAAETAFAEREAAKDAEIGKLRASRLHHKNKRAEAEAEAAARIQSDAVELARCREALGFIRTAIKNARDRVPDEDEGLAANLFAHFLNRADDEARAALAARGLEIREIEK